MLPKACIRNLRRRTYSHCSLEAEEEAVKDTTGLLQLKGAFIFTEEFHQGLAGLTHAFHLFLSFLQPHLCSLDKRKQKYCKWLPVYRYTSTNTHNIVLISSPKVTVIRANNCSKCYLEERSHLLFDLRIGLRTDLQRFYSTV